MVITVGWLCLPVQALYWQVPGFGKKPRQSTANWRDTVNKNLQHKTGIYLEKVQRQQRSTEMAHDSSMSYGLELNQNKSQIAIYVESDSLFTVSMLEFTEVGINVQLASFGLIADNDPVHLQQVIGICCWNTRVPPLALYSIDRFHAAASSNSLYVSMPQHFSWTEQTWHWNSAIRFVFRFLPRQQLC